MTQKQLQDAQELNEQMDGVKKLIDILIHQESVSDNFVKTVYKYGIKEDLEEKLKELLKEYKYQFTAL